MIDYDNNNYDKNEYTELNQKKYGAAAESMAKMQRKVNKYIKKNNDICNKVNINLNRLHLYVTNEFCKSYSYKKDTIAFLENNVVEIHNNKKVNIAMIKYQESQENENTEDENELEELGFFCINEDDLCTNNEENIIVLYDTKKDIRQYLPNVKKSYFLNNKQINTLKQLTEKYDASYQKYTFIKSKLDDLEYDYSDMFARMVDELEKDKNYDFDCSKHELIIVRNKKTLEWSLVYIEVGLKESFSKDKKIIN